MSGVKPHMVASSGSRTTSLPGYKEPIHAVRQIILIKLIMDEGKKLFNEINKDISVDRQDVGK